MRRTVIRRAGLAIAVFLTLAGVGATFAAFSGTTSNSGSSFNSASTFLAFVRNVGTADCGGASDSVTVPASGVAAGDTLIVRAAYRDRGSIAFATSVSDSAGNAYQRDLNDTQNPVRGEVWSAYVATPLAAGDTITVTHPDLDGNSMAVSEFRGVDAIGRVDQAGSNSGNSQNPSASVTTTNGNDLIIGSVAHDANDTTITQPGGWNALPSVGTDCGIPPPHTLITLHGAYRIVSSTGTYTYDPTLPNNHQWVDEVSSYKG